MKPAGQMTLTLTPELEKFVRAEVKRGAFASSSEYVRELVRARYQAAKGTAARDRAIDEGIRRGLADADAGRILAASAAFKILRKELGLKPKSRAK